MPCPRVGVFAAVSVVEVSCFVIVFVLFKKNLEDKSFLWGH